MSSANKKPTTMTKSRNAPSSLPPDLKRQPNLIEKHTKQCEFLGKLVKIIKKRVLQEHPDRTVNDGATASSQSVPVDNTLEHSKEEVRKAKNRRFAMISAKVERQFLDICLHALTQILNGSAKDNTVLLTEMLNGSEQDSTTVLEAIADGDVREIPVGTELSANVHQSMPKAPQTGHVRGETAVTGGMPPATQASVNILSPSNNNAEPAVPGIHPLPPSKCLPCDPVRMNARFDDPALSPEVMNAIVRDSISWPDLPFEVLSLDALELFLQADSE